MVVQNQKKRLDEVLYNQGLLSESEVREALMHQKAHGLKFGSALLYLRYIDETALVRALASQMGCEGVILSKLKIPPNVVKMLPEKVVRARNVMPFEFDKIRNILKIACEDPTLQKISQELKFASGKEVKLYVAAEIALKTAIAKYYLGQDTTLEENLLLEIPDDATETGKIAIQREGSQPDQGKPVKPAILLVSDETFAAPLLQSLLERDDYKVVITDSTKNVIDHLEKQKFDIIFIKETIADDTKDLVDRIRKISLSTVVRYYKTVSSLLFNKDIIIDNTNLLIKNLDLFTMLLSSKAKLPVNHSGRVGQFTDKLCRKLKLPDKDRIIISNTAYIHDLAVFYYGNNESQDNRQTVQLTGKLLASLNYSPIVLDILHSMYISLEGKYTHNLPLGILGGNILTVVDLFCDSIPENDSLTLDKFDAIKKKLRDKSGKLFINEVVEAFIEMIQEEILNIHTTQKTIQIMIYAEYQPHLQPLVLRLKNEGFRIISHSSHSTIVELYNRSCPDLLILVVPGEPANIITFIGELINNGINFEKTPTFLLTDKSSISDLTTLFEKNIEDIITLDDNLDLLVGKVRKLQANIIAKDKAEKEVAGETSGARGRLADMSLIDLLQALGPSLKTVKMAIQPNIPDTGLLTLYLNKGNIHFAEFEDLTGAEAIYKALTWTDGTWIVEPITVEELPPLNNELSNDAILMEGCYRLDENIKAGKLL